MPDGLVPAVLAALEQARSGAGLSPEPVLAARRVSVPDTRGATMTKGEAPKKFAGFLSHFKHECGTEARLVQLQLKPILQRAPICTSTSDVFLDSDDLSDLRNLLNHVKETQVLVLLQSKGVLTRPWVIIELFTAITSGVPIVALNVQNANRYDYAAASEFLLNFDADIEVANPGAAQLLIDMGIDPVDVAYRLSDCLPNIKSIRLRRFPRLGRLPESYCAQHKRCGRQAGSSLLTRLSTATSFTEPPICWNKDRFKVTLKR